MIAQWTTMLNVLPLCSHAGGYVATKERLPVFLVPDLTKVEVSRMLIFTDQALLSVLGAHKTQAQCVSLYNRAVEAVRGCPGAGWTQAVGYAASIEGPPCFTPIYRTIDHGGAATIVFPCSFVFFKHYKPAA